MDTAAVLPLKWPLENHKEKEHEGMDDDKGSDTHFEPSTWKLKLKFLQENKKVKQFSLMNDLKETLKFYTFLKFQVSLGAYFLLIVPW